MKKIFKNKILKHTALVIGILVLPISLFADETVGFSSGPNAEFSSFDSGQGVLLVSGRVSGPQDLVATSVVISYAILTAAPNLSTFTGPYPNSFNNTDGNFLESNMDFSFNINQAFVAGTNYYVILKVTGQSPTSGSSSYQEYVSITAPMSSGGTPTSTPATINLNLENPINIASIPLFLQSLIHLIIKIAIPLVAIVMVYCGLLFVTARGDSAQIEKARNAFTYAVIGGLVLLASWLIAEAIRDALTSLAYVI